MKNLYLSFPQWQGAGYNSGLYHGAREITKSLKPSYNFQEIEVKTPYQISEKKNIIGLEDILSQLQQAIELIKSNQPDRIFTIGGDCSTELAPIDYLNGKLEGNMKVLWIDAHADLNTPQSSPSKEFHGMPLRTLLNEGEDSILNLLKAPLNSSQVSLLGVRELDAPELEFIDREKVQCYNVHQISENVSTIIDRLVLSGVDNLYVHIDLDVLDPTELSSVKCPTPNGLKINVLLDLITALKQNFNIVGCNVLEYTHAHKNELTQVVKIARSIFG